MHIMNCKKGLRVKILSKSIGNDISCIADVRQGVIWEEKSDYIIVRVGNLPPGYGAGGIYKCNFKEYDLEPLNEITKGDY